MRHSSVRQLYAYLVMCVQCLVINVWQQLPSSMKRRVWNFSILLLASFHSVKIQEFFCHADTYYVKSNQRLRILILVIFIRKNCSKFPKSEFKASEIVKLKVFHATSNCKNWFHVKSELAEKWFFFHTVNFSTTCVDDFYDFLKQ